MKLFQEWLSTLGESFSNMFGQVAEYIPIILGGIAMLLLGWFFAKIVAFLIRKGLQAVQLDKRMAGTPAQQFLSKAQVKQPPSRMLARFFFWFIFLTILVGLFDAWGWDAISANVSSLIGYLPNVLLALAILVGGLAVAGWLKKTTQEVFSSYSLRSARVMSSILFYVLALIVIISTLDQLQLNVDLLTSNVMIIVGGIVLAFAIGYGLSAREILPHIIASFYLKNHYRSGQKIRIGTLEGTIKEINNIHVVIENGKETIVIPAKKLIAEEVHILS